MSMPKGYKSKNGYATVGKQAGGLGYREIAEKMTAAGDKMNHSTARNIFISAMEKVARDACSLFDVEPSKENIKRISNDPRFQSGVIDILNDRLI